jgi:hypothetical protein
VAEDLTRLKRAYLEARASAGVLAGEIAGDMKSLTVHDETHLDALWEIASDIAGDGVRLNPPEALVFGGAVLVHDLGLGVAAYTGGIEELKSGEDWKDALAVALKNRLGRFPTAAELASPARETQDDALQILLRQRHAAQAEKLGLVKWTSDGEDYHLFPAQDLRMAYGALIGEIAGSHWWELEDVRARLDRTVNPLPGHPAHWTIDVLKLACLLRVADAVHIDARRAPTFLRALRRPSGVSDLHWVFQGRLLRPVVVHDRIRFNSGKDFVRADARAWWIGFDLIRAADRELRGVDDLLADLDRQRFQARGVLGANDPQLLARFVRTRGWTPIDASLKVSDVGGLIERLGGAALYGNDPSVPLRELLQNASDAVRARRTLEGRPSDWGEITVTIGPQSAGRAFIEVSDTGVGMSVETLTTTLLDFGNSLWRSPDLIDLHPGLAAAGYEPTGRFGIGFFSVLMWGDHVQVTSRRMQDGIAATRTLELIDGVESRPLLRPASEDERLLDGGTAVRVWLNEAKSKLHEENDVWLALSGQRSLDAAVSAVRWLAPALPVKVRVRIGDRCRTAIEGEDWSTIPGKQMLARCAMPGSRLRRYVPYSSSGEPALIERRLTIIRDISGDPVARICVNPESTAIVTVGGFRADRAHNIAGIILGDAPNLARNKATPKVEREAFIEWLSAQRESVDASSPEPWHVRLAATLLAYDLPTGDLPICWDRDGAPMGSGQVAQYASQHDEVLITSELRLEDWLSEKGYAEHLTYEIYLFEDFFNLDVAPFQFATAGLPGPSPYPARSVEDLVHKILASEWGVPSLESQQADVVVGNFRDHEVAVPVGVYVRPSPDSPASSSAG